MKTVTIVTKQKNAPGMDFKAVQILDDEVEFYVEAQQRKKNYLRHSIN